MSDYPTEKELRTIRNWKGTFRELWDYVVERWKYAEWGVKVEICFGGIDKLELHTAGWIGNEEIIHAMQMSKNLFFPMFHTKWERGGHFYFEVQRDMWDFNPTAKAGVTKCQS